MAWYNSLKDLTGDIGNIAKKAAPIAAPLVLGPVAGGILAGATRVLGGSGSTDSGSVVDPNDPFGVYGQGPSSGGGLLQGIRQALPSILGGGGGMSLPQLATGGLAAYQAVNAANASKRSNELSDKALSLAEQNWAGGAPLRAAGTQGLLSPTRVNLSSVYADPTNPFARRSR